MKSKLQSNLEMTQSSKGKVKIQLQSEGEEIFYQDILLEPITEFPIKFGILF